MDIKIQIVNVHPSPSEDSKTQSLVSDKNPVSPLAVNNLAGVRVSSEHFVLIPSPAAHVQKAFSVEVSRS